MPDEMTFFTRTGGLLPEADRLLKALRFVVTKRLMMSP